MRKKALVFLVIAQSLICLSGFRVLGVTDQPDELWAKAVQLASINQMIIPGKTHMVIKERYFFGKVKTIEETWDQLVETEDGNQQTKVLKSLADGKEKSDLAENQIQDAKQTFNYILDDHDLTIPFMPRSQHNIIISKLTRSETKDGQNCAVYHFQCFLKAKGVTMRGKAWINPNGIPIVMQYRFDSLPKEAPPQIHSITQEVHYQYQSDGSWYPRQVLVQIKPGFRSMIFNPVFQIEYTFSDFQKSKILAIISGGKRLADPQRIYTVPFDYDNFLYVKVRLNDSGTDYRFMVDTGASVTVISPRIATELGLKKAAELDVSDGYMAQKSDAFIVPKISLGEVAVVNCGAVVFDLANLEKFGAKVDGIIGSNFLRLFTLRIDYAKQRLTFCSNTDFFGEEIARSHKILVNQDLTGAVFMPFRVFGAKTAFPAEIDTGYDGSLSVPVAFMEEFKPGLNCPVVKSKGITTRGAFGEAAGMLSRINEFRVGDLYIKNHMITFTESKDDFLLLGNRILSLFTVIIDYSKSTLYLCPLENQTFDTNKLSHGFEMDKGTNGKAYVGAIWEGTPADRGGLRVGDVILRAAADGESGSTYEEVYKLMAYHETIHLFVQRDDGEMEITLKREPLLPEVF